MAFVSTLDVALAVDVDILRRGGEYVAIAPIGFDDDKGTTYSILVALSPLPGSDTVELIFAVNEADPEGGEPHSWYDGLATRPIIGDRAIRAVVMRLICGCISDLIDIAMPESLSMMTHTPDLPSKALRKYDEIVNVVVSKGYEPGPIEKWHGRLTWTMGRRPEPEK